MNSHPETFKITDSQTWWGVPWTTDFDDVQDLQVSRDTRMSEATGGSAGNASLHGSNLLEQHICPCRHH